MIPYGHQKIGQSDIDGVEKVLRSDWLTQGPKVLEFEKMLARYCGVKYAVVCSSGTSALHLAYSVAGLKKGDEAITTPNTFVATSNMMLAVGAKPVFCDIRPDTRNIDEGKIETLITKKTKAVAPVHFAGQSCAMKEIKQIARRHKLIIIEDACHALGGKYENSKIGSCRYSDLAVFSFHPVKSITTGEGGAITTNNKKYYEKLISLRSHGIHKDAKGKNVMTELGFNYRMTDIQAVLGISQLKKLDGFIKKRRQIAKWYAQELKNIPQILLPQETKDNYSAWHIYVIRASEPGNRDALAAFLKANGVGVNFHYPAVYAHPYYQNNGYKGFKLANEEIYQNSCLTLPCYPDLTEKQVKFIAGLIKKYFKTGARTIFDQKIIGEKIYLRKIKLTDVSKDYCDWLNDKEVNKDLAVKNWTMNELRIYAGQKINDPNCFFAGIFDKKNDQLIGTVKLESIDWKKKQGQFGLLVFNKNYWHQGIGSEATQLFIEHAFNALGLKKISLVVYRQIQSAFKIYKKAGFKIDRIKRGMVHGDKIYDEVKMFIKK